jgi:flagellar basal-body rod protein FlgB
MMTTRGNHIASSGGSASGTKEIDQKKTYEVAPTGNAVILEEQILKMNETMMDHRFISNMYQKNVELLNRSVKE